jgi:hypothetical protein
VGPTFSSRYGTRHMEIGSDRRAELEEVFTHERISVPLDEVVDPKGQAEPDV